MPGILRAPRWKQILFVVGLVGILGYSEWEGHDGRTVDSTSWWRRDFGDGAVVLVRKGPAVGAFKLLGRDRTELRYAWIFRDDGGGRLDPADPAVHTGEATSNEVGSGPIAFGPFAVPWSVSGMGRSYLYYELDAREPVLPGATRLAVTDLEDFAGIDADDPAWRYKGARRDDACYGGLCR